MGALLSRVLLGVVVTAAALSVLDPAISDAQPDSRPTASPGTDTRAAARKLVKEGIAAQDAGDQGRAITLYLKAFSLEPHPMLLFNIGQAHRLAGCFERAIQFYDRYLALDPQGAQAATARTALAELQRASNPDAASCAKVVAPNESTGNRSATAAPPGRLKLHSAPDGVEVMLDGEKIGVTPLERELAAGPHTIVLVDGGMLAGEQKVDIGIDETLELTIPVERSARSSPSQGPSRLVPVLLWSGGVLALAGSGVLLYLGQKGGPAHPEDRYIYRGATPTGYAFAATGAAALAAGAWWWLHRSRESAPVASISSSSGYFGWQGRF